MVETRKILGQVAPAASTITSVYTCPKTATAVVSTLFICNRSAAASNFFLSIIPFGAALADRHYLYYDVPVPANDTAAITVGLTLAGGDAIYAYNVVASLSYSVFGVEVT